MTFLLLAACKYRHLLYKLTFFVTIVVHVESLFKNPLIRCSTMDTLIFSFKIYIIR